MGSRTLRRPGWSGFVAEIENDCVVMRLMSVRRCFPPEKKDSPNYVRDEFLRIPNTVQSYASLAIRREMIARAPNVRKLVLLYSS